MKLSPTKLLLYLTIALFLGGLYYFFTKTKVTAIQAIPYNSALIVQSCGIDSVLQEVEHNTDAVFRDILKFSVFSQLKNDLQVIKGIFPENTPINGALLNKNFAMGINFSETDSLHAIFAIDMEEKVAPEQWLIESKSVLKKFPSSFKNQTIYTLLLAKNERFAVCGYKNLLLFAKKPYLIEDAITTLEKDNGIWKDASVFKSDEIAIGQAFIYLNTENWSEQINGKLATQWNTLPDLLTRNLRYLKFNFDGKNLKSTWSGQGFFEAMNNWGKVDKKAIFSVLPDNTAAIFWAGFKNKLSFFSNFGSKQSTDFQYFIEEWAGNECAFVLSEPFSENLAEEQFLIFSIKDSLRAQKRMEEYGQRFGLLKNYDYQTFKLRQYASQVPLFPILGTSNALFRNPVSTQLGNYMVFAHSPAALERLVDKFIVNQTLSNQVDFLLLQKNISQQSSSFVLLNSSLLTNVAKTFLTPKAYEKSTSDWKIFKKMGFLGFDISPINNQNLEVTLSQQSLQEQGLETSILWKTPLAAAIISTPVVLKNTKTSPEISILVQDARHQLYCHNVNGELIWKRQLKGKMQSTIHGVDYLNNGTLYFLCNTSNEILLLDEEGNDVEGFPLPLHSPASNGVSVAHFGEAADYGFFIACKNGNLYGFDRHGRPLPGWNPQPNIGSIKQALLHFQDKNKDFLCFLNQEGNLNVFNKNGDLRFESKFMGVFNSPIQIDLGKQSPRIVAVNSEGKAYICNLEGKTFSLQLATTIPNQKVNFVFAPILGDMRYDYVLNQGNSLQISAYEGTDFKIRQSKVLNSTLDTLFNVNLTNNTQQIGAINRTKQQIYLFDAQLKMHPDFPLAGTTPFTVSDIFQDGKNNILVVGHTFNLYAYKIK
jgi:hypothetical protein